MIGTVSVWMKASCNGVCVSQVCIWRDCLRPACACACNFTSASGGSLLWRTGDKCSVASEELSTTAITLHSPELSRWSVPYSELNTMSVALRVGGFGNRVEKTAFGKALFRVGRRVDGLKVEN